MLTALAAIITAISGLLLAMHQVGLFNARDAPVHPPAETEGLASADATATTPAGSPEPTSGTDKTGLPAADLAVPQPAPTEKLAGGIRVHAGPVVTTPDGPFGITRPFTLEPGTTYKMTLRRNEANYFKLSEAIASGSVILDMRLASNKRSNLMSVLSMLDQDGGHIQKRTISMNAIDVGYRKMADIALRQKSNIGFKLLNNSDEAHFWLTVLRQHDAGLVPLFGEVVPRPLSIGSTTGGKLAEGEDVYYAVAASRGSYKLILDFENAEGRNTNLQGHLAVLEPEEGDEKRLIGMNEIDISFRWVATMSVQTDRTAIIRINNSNDAVNYALKILAN
ncbi:hypothetical protein [Piscinibacter sakaiensis]|uniref:hypothetical protein n=1 Tax=Piscinibacter sakaiensis TaxID=1547922 RepID=UPI003AAD2EC2